MTPWTYPLALPRRLRCLLPCLAILAGLSSTGCSVNPATGQRQLTLISEAQEIEIGRQNDAQIVTQMGLYGDQELQNYMQELGSSLAAKSERPNLPWTFRVVDDPVVNAFALPGGYIYITRGIMAHFNSEAELVSVLGHEIGHVTGRHGVERMSKAQLAQIGLGVAAVASEDFRPFAGLAQQGLGLLFLKFSRDDERQADDLGLRYLLAGEYDPDEMPNVFNTLDRMSAAQGPRTPGWLATHPAPANRAARLGEVIAGLPPEYREGKIDREGYLQRLSGMTFGTDPREGYTVDNTFYHPEMAFALDFPSGWRVVNQRQAVGAISPEEDAVMVLTVASEDSPNAVFQNFFQQEGVHQGQRWRDGFYFFNVAPPTQDGSRPTTRYQGLVGTVQHQGQLFQLLSYAGNDQWSGRRQPVQDALASFRRLTNRRYLDVQSKKVEVVTLRQAMTLAEFQRRYPSNVELAELAILNGVTEQETLPRGTRLKRITGGELPDS